MATQTLVTGVNNHATSVGAYVDQQGIVHGFQKRLVGDAVTVDVPGTTFNQLLGINSLGHWADIAQWATGRSRWRFCFAPGAHVRMADG